MKEYIFQPTIAQDGNAIVITDAPTGLIKKNILAIINKSTKGIIHSPLLDGIASLTYSGTTLTINLNAGHPSIEGNLLIKAYIDEEVKQLMPTAEVVAQGVMFHFITLAQMEKMHIRIEGTDTGTLGFTLTKGENNFELRFSADSPQAFAGELVYDDSIDIVDYVFGDLLVQIPTGYEVIFVNIDGVDANMLEADINWRLADLQKRIGEGGGDSESAEQVKDFFHIVKDGDTVKVITEDGGEEVVVPVELATEQEVKDINDDVMGALYGYGKVTVTIHSLMRTGAETTQDLASVIYVDPEKTWAENGYPTLYDDEGEPIDTTSNPAAGDEVFNYQIQSES